MSFKITDREDIKPCEAMFCEANALFDFMEMEKCWHSQSLQSNHFRNLKDAETHRQISERNRGRSVRANLIRAILGHSSSIQAV